MTTMSFAGHGAPSQSVVGRFTAALRAGASRVSVRLDAGTTPSAGSSRVGWNTAVGDAVDQDRQRLAVTYIDADQYDEIMRTADVPDEPAPMLADASRRRRRS